VTESLSNQKEELIELGRDLIRGWDARPDVAVFRRDDLAPIVILAFATHTHRLAPIILDLLERGSVVEATPLIRLAYENAFTCMWINQVPDSVAGFMNEGVKKRRATARTLREAGDAIQPGLAELLEQDLPDDLDTSSNGPAGNFQQLCNDLEPGGAYAYALYRYLTQYSHPTMKLGDLFLRNPENPGSLPVYDPNAQLPTGSILVHLTACTLVWAGSAMDLADRDRPRCAELDRAARRLEICPELRLSETARNRLIRTRN